MKLLVFGHSYVRDLAKLNVNQMMIEQRSVEIKYVSKPGASYESINKQPELLTEAITYKPDVVIIILGGNSIIRDRANYEIFRECRSFYQLLRSELPNAIVISAQVELRFYDTPNKFGAPSIELFRQKRSELNRFLNRLKLKNNVLIIAGPGRLDNESYYRDGVHLNNSGLRVYMAILKSTVCYAVQKSKQN